MISKTNRRFMKLVLPNGGFKNSGFEKWYLNRVPFKQHVFNHFSLNWVIVEIFILIKFSYAKGGFTNDIVLFIPKISHLGDFTVRIFMLSLIQ